MVNKIKRDCSVTKQDLKVNRSYGRYWVLDMRRLIRLAIAVGIGIFLFTQAPDLTRNAVANLQGQAGAIMPVAMR